MALLPPPFPLPGAAVPPLPPVMLLEDVAVLRFGYFDGRTWQPAWLLAEKLPQAVRIEMVRQHGDVWPAQIVEIATAPK